PPMLLPIATAEPGDGFIVVVPMVPLAVAMAPVLVNAPSIGAAVETPTELVPDDFIEPPSVRFPFSSDWMAIAFATSPEMVMVELLWVTMLPVNGPEPLSRMPN